MITENRGKGFSFFPAMLVAAGFTTGWATEYFVSPQGSDAAPGTLAEPFRTLTKAADIMQAGDICNVRGGTYRETVKPKKSGASGSPIVFQAYNNETVTLSGGDALTGWTVYKGNIYQAAMNWNLGIKNQLIYDGKMMYQARWPNHPNDGVFEIHDGRASGGGEGWLACDSLPNLPWKDAVIWIAANHEWCQWTARITRYDAANKRLEFPLAESWVGRNGTPGRGTKFNLTGPLETLDYPGEWFCDSVAKKMYFWAPDGANPNGHVADAKRREFAVDISGLSYIHIVGLTIIGAGIDMRETRNCLVRKVRARYVAHHIAGEVINYTDNTGMFLSGESNLVDQCEIGYSSGSGISISGNNNIINDTWVHHCDYMATYDAPINVSGMGNKIRRCRVWYSGRDGINMKADESRSEISYTDVAFSGQRADDCSGIYTVGHDGQGTTLHHNWVHDAQCTKVHAHLIMNDDYTKGTIDHHNLLWNSTRAGITCGSGKNVAIYNNTLWHCNTGSNAVLPLRIWEKGGHANEDVRIYNNLVDLGLIKFETIRGTDYQNNLFLTPTSPDPWVDRDHGDFRLKSGSAAIDAGRVITGYTEGFSGSAPDIGAYESGATDSNAFWTAGITWDTAAAPTALWNDKPLPGAASDGPRSMRLSISRNDHDFMISSENVGFICVVNLKGSVVKTILVQSGSQYWDGRNSRGERLPKGLYLFEAVGLGRITQRITVD